MKKRARSGQAIVEAMVALGVLTVGFLGIMNLLSRSLGTYRVTVDQYTATYLAAEGIELSKNLIDAGTIRGDAWGTVLPPGAYEMDDTTDLGARRPEAYLGRMLAFDSASNRYRYGSGTPTSFRRKIVIERAGPDEIRVNAVVDWTTRGGATFSVNVEDHFFKWR